MFRPRFFRRCFVAFAAVATALATQGGDAGAAFLTRLDSRTGFGADDSVDFGVLGPEGTVVPTAVLFSTFGGSAVVLDRPGGTSVTINYQVAPGTFGPGASAGFRVGDAVLSPGISPGEIYSLTFGTPIRGGGLQITSFFLGAYTARVEAFGVGNVSLGSFQRAGVTTGAADDSALFLGILSDTADIVRVEYSSVAGPVIPLRIIVNQFDFLSALGNGPGPKPRPEFVPPPPIPEPSAVALLCLGGIGAAGVFAVRRRRHAAS